MSHVGTVWAWKQTAGGAMTKLVLLQLADEASKVGVITYSTNASIAAACECSARSVQRHIDSLVSDGIVELQRAGGRFDGRNVSAQYRLRYERDGAVDALLSDVDLKVLGRARMSPIPPPEPVDNGGDRLSPPTPLGVTACPLGVTESPVGGDTLSPIPGNYPGTTTLVGAAAADPVDNSKGGTEPDDVAEPAPLEAEHAHLPITIPPPPPGVDAAELATDDAAVRVRIEEYEHALTVAGYDTEPMIANPKAFAVLVSWARGGLTAPYVAHELGQAQLAAEGPIARPVAYLAKRFGNVAPRLRSATPTSTLPDSIRRARETVKAPRSAAAEALTAAGVRPRATA